MNKGIFLSNISIDCKDGVRLQSFYAELLGWEKLEIYGCPAVRNQQGLLLLFMPANDFDYIQPVWPEQPEKQQKQIHLDFEVEDLSSAIIQAEAIGAVKAQNQYGGEHFVTMFDPEGHPFCLCAQ